MKFGTEIQQNFTRKMIELDPWMTNFFGFPYAYVKGDVSEMDFQQNPGMLLEWRIPIGDLTTINRASQLGFEMMEVMVDFETEIQPVSENLPFLRPYRQGDLETLLQINFECFVSNPKFSNRFKSEKYFQQDKANEYFEMGIRNFVEKESAIVVVGEDEMGIFGYYIMDGQSPLYYKGISTSVLPRVRGKQMHIHMQRKASEMVGQPYTVLNRTQASNYAVLNNHIKEKRKLTAITSIFLKKLP